MFIVLLKKASNSTKLFEFILYLLTEPQYSSVIAWEGTSGQFRIIRPDEVARLWGERNGRPNMTFKSFRRCMRYSYNKNVLTKIRGRSYTYKFNLHELEKEYRCRSLPFPAKSGKRGYTGPCTPGPRCAKSK